MPVPLLHAQPPAHFLPVNGTAVVQGIWSTAHPDTALPELTSHKFREELLKTEAFPNMTPVATSS